MAHHKLMRCALLLTAAFAAAASTGGERSGGAASGEPSRGQSGAQAGEHPIYRTTGPDGGPVFTDRPGAAPAERVDLSPGNSFEPGDLPVTRPERGRAASGSTENASVYEIAIESPGADQTVRENAGNLTVVSRVEPALAAGDRLQLLLDGAPAGTSTDGVFQLTAVDRGTHQLQVRVVDTRGRVHATSAAHSFHLLRHSVLNR